MYRYATNSDENEWPSRSFCSCKHFQMDFFTVVQQFASFKLTLHVARSLCGSWASLKPGCNMFRTFVPREVARVGPQSSQCRIVATPVEENRMYDRCAIPIGCNGMRTAAYNTLDIFVAIVTLTYLLTDMYLGCQKFLATWKKNPDGPGTVCGLDPQ